MSWYLNVLKNYAGFSGRARRKEYWMFALFHAIFIVVLAGIGVAIDTQIPYFIYFIALFIPSLAVTVRRLHDTGRSGWWVLIGCVPFVNIALLVFTFLDSAPEANEYGANPKLAPQGV
ncbi:DUF805 domain-containing protein [Streptomyces sp. NBC_00887]|uniref:DUF805 domain-containing protein n=1 Tax=Streptomyces sp. NBC_00887 TaxID=2975859 RepID=UPI00386F39C3|nr:DUF805 domain-containing protein [Streptomyces sp. NBC_00887]